jgi:putative transposase
MMQSLGRRYVRYFNDRNRRTGTLWEERYKSTLVDSDSYFFTLTRYIELNPVRANIVSHPRDYRWSSFHANALGERDSLVTWHPLYIGLGLEDRERQAQYKAMFDIVLEEDLLNELRDATNKGWAFGCTCFKNRLRAIANRPVESSGWGGDRRSLTELDQGL